MSKMLEVNIQTVNDKIKFACRAENKPEIITDFYPPIGGGEGYTSLELLLTSLSTCVTTTLLLALRGRMKKSVSSASAKATGRMRDEHPRILDEITLEITLVSSDLARSEVDIALAAVEQQICPVWAMLKGNTRIEVKYVIQAEN